MISTSVNGIEDSAAEHDTIDVRQTRSSQDALEEIKEAKNWKHCDQDSWSCKTHALFVREKVCNACK